MEVKYRSEEPFGEGYRDVIPVMTHEIYELGNIDIFETLISGIYDIPGNLTEECKKMIDTLQIEEVEENEISRLCEQLIKEVNKNIGREIKYCLWLADKDTVKDYYCQGKDCKIDTYETGYILSDCGYDGCLYGYEELPQPI